MNTLSPSIRACARDPVVNWRVTADLVRFGSGAADRPDRVGPGSEARGPRKRVKQFLEWIT